MEGPPEHPKRGRSRAELEARAHEARLEFEAQLRATNERIEKRTGRNLPLAILIGLGLGLTLLFSLIVVKQLFMLFAAALIAFTAFELASALRFAGRDVPRVPVVIASVGIVPFAFYGHAPGQWLAILAGMLLVSLWRVAEQIVPARRTAAAELWKDLGSGVLILSYVPFLASFAVIVTSHEGGEWWVLAALITVVSIDTGAYASGLLFGRHPMAPRISPKKTWEGFAGSVLVALVAGVLLATLMLGQPWWVGLVLGGALTITATVGDLTESMIKRDLGIKDISTWLPGHGGFLDRLDSVLPSMAVLYALHLVFVSA